MPIPESSAILGTFAPGMLAGQSAMVTGGSRGIGRAAALALAAAGANVAIGYHRDEEAARLVCDEAAASGVGAEPFAVDVAQPQEVSRAAAQVADTFGAIDILVNSAGVWPQGRFWEIDDADWRRTLAINLDGTFYACKAVSPGMIDRRRGRIVNFSSIAAARGARTGHADYAASKGAVVSLTRSLAFELGPYSITVNAIAPGVIRTDMTREALVEREDSYRSQIALGRIGTADEVAAAVLFLVSPAGEYVTGQTLAVDGGM
jgi:3-oxoacyl-[acyl-carrier protein] reductase